MAQQKFSKRLVVIDSVKRKKLRDTSDTKLKRGIKRTELKTKKVVSCGNMEVLKMIRSIE